MRSQDDKKKLISSSIKGYMQQKGEKDIMATPTAERVQKRRAALRNSISGKRGKRGKRGENEDVADI
jgi:hypothetical protein